MFEVYKYVNKMESFHLQVTETFTKKSNPGGISLLEIKICKGKSPDDRSSTLLSTHWSWPSIQLEIATIFILH